MKYCAKMEILTQHLKLLSKYYDFKVINTALQYYSYSNIALII